MATPDWNRPAGPSGRLLIFHLLIGALGLTAVAAADLTTDEIAMSIFYLVVIAYVAWFAGRRYGIAFSFVSSVLWYHGDDLDRGVTYSHEWIGYWNAFVRFLIFATMTFLLDGFRRSLNEARIARDLALDATRAKSEFLANMSHEIRTPMNALLGMADLLASTSLSDRQKSYVDIFRREGQRLLQLINDLLDLSKIEAGRYTAEKVAFSLRRLIEEIASLARVQADAKGLILDLDIAPDTPDMIESDAVLIRRILLNLLNNAVKFTTEGRVTLRCLAEDTNRVRFCVEDTGLGIDPETVARLFQPFSQADASITRRFGGTGLGLSLVKNFAALLDGRVSVESEVGRGSRFHVVLPFSQTTAVFRSPDQAEAPPPDVRPLKILLVDDYDVNRQVVQAFLAERPYVIDEATNGREALARFKSGSYNIVLMDIQMPEMDGYEATRAIRAWERERGWNTTPVIALTAHAYEEDRRKSLEAGCTAHLAKPIDRPALLRAVYEFAVDRGEEPSPAVGSSEPKQKVDAVILRLRPKFIESLNEAQREIRSALERGELARIAAIGHRLRGSGATFGFPDIARIGADLEMIAGQGDLNRTRRLVDELSTAAHAITEGENR